MNDFDLTACPKIGLVIFEIAGKFQVKSMVSCQVIIFSYKGVCSDKYVKASRFSKSNFLHNGSSVRAEAFRLFKVLLILYCGKSSGQRSISFVAG